MAAYWYTDIQSVTDYATSTGDLVWTSKTVDNQKLSLEYATRRIEQEIGMPRQDGIIPYGYGDNLLREACKFVALDISRTLNQILTNEKNRVLTDSSFSDGILSVNPAKNIPIDNRASLLINDFLVSNGLNVKSNQWSRA